MKAKVLTAALGAVTAALAAGVMWTAPAASAGTPFCDSLGPKDARECNCGFDNVPGTPEYQGCLHGVVAVPAPAPVPAPPGQ